MRYSFPVHVQVAGIKKLTYGSIARSVQRHVDAGRLYIWLPAHRDPDFVAARCILMTQEAWEQCPPSGRRGNENLTPEMLDNTRATLRNFVIGRELVNNIDVKCLRPPRNENSMIGYDVWTLRVIEYPKVRLFGWFFAFDGFLVNHLESRDALGTGKKGLKNFEAAINKVNKKHAKKLCDTPRHYGGCLSDYISKAMEDADDDDI